MAVTDEPDPETAEALRQGAARTVAEAVRLAAIEFLRVLESEIVATYRWTANNGLEFVLYDSVPGGAGYVQKIKSDFTISALFERAKKILTCTCTHGCRNCIRMYSNQWHWASFEPKRAIRWIETLSVLGTEDRWSHLISPEQLSRELDKADHIQFVVSDLGFSRELWDEKSALAEERGEPQIGDLFPAWKNLKKWLDEGKRVTLYLRCPIDFSDPGKKTAPWFFEGIGQDYLRSGKLAFRQLKKSASVPLELRAILGSGEGRLQLRDFHHESPLLKQILSKVVAEIKEPAIQLDSLSETIDADTLKAASLRRVHYRKGEQRDLERDFSFLKGRRVASVEIYDPYVTANARSVETCKQFLEKLATMWDGAPDHIMAFSSTKSDLYGERQTHERTLTSFLKAFVAPNGSAFAKNRPSSRQRDFHDRYISIELHRPQAATRRARTSSAATKATVARARNGDVDSFTVELSGGIDRLMDPEFETRLYVFDPKA